MDMLKTYPFFNKIYVVWSWDYIDTVKVTVQIKDLLSQQGQRQKPSLVRGFYAHHKTYIRFS